MDLKALLLLLLVEVVSVASRNLQPKAAAKTSSDQKSASSGSDYKTISGPDDKGNNYIPFQWQVEIIKREYDDYLLPDGTVYRVPQGAVPPHRYKGSRPYDVPYYVFKEDKGHSGQIYGNRPKLVETYDTQALELLMQDWYEEQLWARGYLGNNFRHPALQDFYGDYDDGGRSAYAPSEKHENTYDKNKAPRSKDRSHSGAPNYFMMSYNGTKAWSDPDYSQASTRVSSKVSENNVGANSRSSQHQINGRSEALGRPNSGGNDASKAALRYFPAPSTRHLYDINDSPDAASKVNVEAGIRPNHHPFMQLFRHGLNSDRDYGP